MDISISDDFKNDEGAAKKALEKTSVAVFYMTKSWFEDKRAQREWLYACRLQKPMIYLVDPGVPIELKHFTPNLLATINNYGNQKQNADYLMAIISVWRKEHGL